MKTKCGISNYYMWVMAMGLLACLGGCASLSSSTSQSSYQFADVEGKWSWTQGPPNVDRALWQGDFVLQKKGDSYAGTLNDVSEGTYGDSIVDVNITDTHIKFKREGRYGVQNWEGTLKREDGVLKIVDGRWTRPSGTGGVFRAEKATSNGKTGGDADTATKARSLPGTSPSVLALIERIGKASGTRPNAELYEDFDRQFKLNWSVLGLDPSHFSLTKVPGTLTITTEDGTFERGESDYKNVFVIDFPAEPSDDWQVTTCVTNYQPHDLWNEAGLILWNDKDNNFKFVYEYGEGPPPNNAQKLLFTAASQNNGYAVHGWFETGQTPVKMWLRIVKEGNLYKLFNSTDGKTFNPMKVILPARLTTDNTTPCLKAPVKYVGIIAYNGLARGAAQVDASFDFFEFKTLPEEPPATKEQTSNEQRKAEPQKIPTTLAEAHAELERQLSPQVLAEIDAMQSEDEMIKYHFGLGMGIRNSWGLWAGGPLAKHMQELGFTHPDDMSGVILGTFWCKRHGQDFRLKERAEKYRTYWEAAKKTEDERKGRVDKSMATMQTMMMGLQFEKREVPTVRLPERKTGLLSVRSLSPFRHGVFIAAQKPWGWGQGAFPTAGYYFDRADRQIHPIQVKEVNEVYSTVVAGETAWFAGSTAGKRVLVGIKGQDRLTPGLPEDDPRPQLGIDGQSLLAVYAKTVYRLTDRKWTAIHSGDIVLPPSGSPPELHDGKLFLRRHDSGAIRPLWLTLDGEHRLVTLDSDMKSFVDCSQFNWYNCFSPCLTKEGDLWACIGAGFNRKSLFRRSKDGTYAIAIMNNSVQFTPKEFGTDELDQGLSVSAIAAVADDTFVLVADNGLYHLKGKTIVKDVAFPNNPTGAQPSGMRWDPGNVLALDDKSYLASSVFGGVYLISKGADDQWSLAWLDEKLGDPVTW